jgi:hypothetical protein
MGEAEVKMKKNRIKILQIKSSEVDLKLNFKRLIIYIKYVNGNAKNCYGYTISDLLEDCLK